MKLHFTHIKALCNYIIATLTLIAFTQPANAQTTPADSLLNRTVIVEQQYNPDIMDAQKVNVVPQVEEIKVIPRAVEYDDKMSPATSLPSETMNAYAGKEVQRDIEKGYVRLGYGNLGNLDARAGYLFNLTNRDKIRIDFRMDGRNGKIPLSTESDDKWKSRFYRTKAGLSYIHQFKKVDMDIAGGLGVSNFNNLPSSPSQQKRFTSGDVHLGFASTSNNLPVQFKAETNLLLYSRHYNQLDKGAFKETLVRTKANVWGKINDTQQVGLALEMNNRFYGYKEFSNITSLLLNPYYEADNDDNWNIHLGVNADVAFGFGKKFNVSPDVKFNYIFSDSYVFYANATGGKLMNDYRRLETYNPHAEIMGTQLDDSYEQLNAMLGLKASPVPGLWFNLYGGYQMLKNDLYCVKDILLGGSGQWRSYATTNTNNIFAGVSLNYDYKNIFGITAYGKYQKWDADEDEAYLLKPEFSAGLQIDVRPIEPLNINVGYTFIQRAKTGQNKRLDAVNNLYLGADYNLYNGIFIYARANNLLNKKYMYYLDYMEQGTSFIGGLSFRF